MAAAASPRWCSGYRRAELPTAHGRVGERRGSAVRVAVAPVRARRPFGGRVAWHAGVRRMAKVDQREALEVLARARLIELTPGV
jgi:hypothetical protein